MNRRPFPSSRPYRLALALCVALGAWLIAFPLLSDHWTGSKAFSAFTRHDWRLFALFLGIELSAGALFYRCTVWACALRAARNAQRRQYLSTFGYDGMHMEDYAFVWFDRSGASRARIANCESGYRLCVDRFDWRRQAWQTIDEVVCASLQAVREQLCFRHRFLCEETCDLFEE